jgi:NAD(P)-dependent dehydrogenase (short-subunit alcohol dehydrogenase family)
MEVPTMVAIDLTGRRALVTGGSSGIGAAIADALAECGADVAINYISHRETAEAAATRYRGAGRRALPVEADVSRPEAVAAMFAAIDREWGGIDILVNNAGIDGRAAPAWEIGLDDWRAVIEVNLFGAFHCAREALQRMVPAGSGVILNLTSVHEVIPWSGFSAYTTAKAGLSMMTKTMAQEAAPHGVRVLAIAPGAIRTAINKAVWSNPEGLADLNTKIPMGRMGSTEEIARMAATLCSDAASYVTGTTLFVDGGMLDYPSFAHGG